MANKNVDKIVLRKGMQFNTVQDDILYVVLNNSKLAKELTGVIKKSQKPVRTQPPKVEDCTISSLSIESGTVQLGTSNVNIYVPDKIDCVTQSDASNTDADTQRIKQLAGLAYEVLEVLQRKLGELRVRCAGCYRGGSTTLPPYMAQNKI